MPDDPTETGKDSPIWIVTRDIHRHHHLQYSEIDSELIINPQSNPPITMPYDVEIKVEPADAIVKVKPAGAMVNATTLTVATPADAKFTLESTPHVGRLTLRLEGKVTWKDAQGTERTAKQIRYIELPG